MGMKKRPRASKPPYKSPTMAEVKAARGSNGLTLVSLFSGCGMACMGYELAGFQPVFANEFIPEAREAYKLNHPGVHVDGRDVREITGEDIFKAAGTRNIDLLEGSPPCASFSSAGNTRGRSKGGERVYGVAGTRVKQRVDDLFDEFIRLVGEVWPRAFAAENVPPLAGGDARPYFESIVGRLVELGYNVQAAVLNARWLGVPQHRERLFIVGFRGGVEFEFPRPLQYQYGVYEAVRDLLPSRPIAMGQGRFRFESINKPSRTLQTVGWKNSRSESSFVFKTETGREHREWQIPVVKRIAGVPDDFQLVGDADPDGTVQQRRDWKQQYERLGRGVPPRVTEALGKSIADALKGTTEKRPPSRRDMRARELRRALVSRVEKLQGEPVALFLSGGVDSNALMIALLEAGVDVAAYSFTLEDRESTDYRRARHNAAVVGVEFKPILLPLYSREELQEDVARLVQAGARNKTTIECAWALVHACWQVDEGIVVCGMNADSHFGISKKASMHYKHSIEGMDAYRKEKLVMPNLQREVVELIAGVTMVLPYRDPAVIDLFMGTAWDDINRPKQKQTIWDAFPELETLDVGPHVNFQLGDSGIAAMFQERVRDEGDKTVVKTYNRIIGQHTRKEEQ